LLHSNFTPSISRDSKPRRCHYLYILSPGAKCQVIAGTGISFVEDIVPGITAGRFIVITGRFFALLVGIAFERLFLTSECPLYHGHPPHRSPGNKCSILSMTFDSNVQKFANKRQ